MIRGVHTMFYSSEPEALRAFLRDKLGLPATDVGHGWLIFDVPEAEMGCHPANEADGAPSGTHHISFYCDDLAKTVAKLKAKGVEFTDDIADHGYGLVTHFKAPGGFAVQLYQPRYTTKGRMKAAGSKKKPAAAKKKPADRKKKLPATAKRKR